jgi:hypothetical protein
LLQNVLHHVGNGNEQGSAVSLVPTAKR